jgi:hypothetical protein
MTYFKKELVLIEDLMRTTYSNSYFFILNYLESPDNDRRKYHASTFRFCEATTKEELIAYYTGKKWCHRSIMTMDTFSKLSPDVVWITE